MVVPEGMPVPMPGESDAVLSSIWDGLRATARDYLAGITLHELTERRRLHDGELMYEI